ncbi:MAG: hypothetical protein MJ150_06475 [Clostridia bacterium]|nr:hypothetical protein [Clostridia bacterium]
MTLDELYELIDIDTPEDFAYFEQMAELLESEENIPFDLFASALSALDLDTATTLIENYFEEFNNAIPDTDDDFVMLIDNVKQALLLAAENIEDSRRVFAEQLFYFREWLHKPDGAVVDKKPMSVLDAVTEHRAEKLGGESHKYIFTSVADYELEELSLSLGGYSKVDILREDYDDSTTKNFNN